MQPARRLALLLLVAFAWLSPMLAVAQQGVSAPEPVDVGGAVTAVDLSGVARLFPDAGPTLQVTAAPNADGVINRIEVLAAGETSSGNWLTFTLANTDDRQIDRVIVVPHYRLPGSRLLRPDLGASRIVAITPSEGFALDRQPSEEADVFALTLEPESVVTFVAELAGNGVPRITLWEPDAYKDTLNSTTLYYGIILGIAGLLAIFLSILFVVKGSAMFPATAALAWAVLGYVCVDFGFLTRIIDVPPSELAIYRAFAEVALAGTLVVFLWAYLHLHRFHLRYSVLVLLWLAGLGALLALAAVAPSTAAGLARLSFAATGGLGLLLILVLAFRGFDRAVMLVPTWLLLLAWTAAGWMTVTGRLDNDIIQPALGGALVLIVLLLAFTVVQHAFVGSGAMSGNVSELERQALALVGAGDAVWDWNVDRDEMFVGPEATYALGLPADGLSGSPESWNSKLHPQDRDRFQSCLDVVLDHRRGRIEQDFRLRARSGQYHWMKLAARPLIGSNGEVMRCVGTLSDVTEDRVTQERLLRDAVYDNLTGLPNRSLFLDRLNVSVGNARELDGWRPSLLLIDLDRFQSVNSSVGLSVGDSILLTMTRRIARLLRPQDSLGRLSGDRFGVIVMSRTEPEDVAAFAAEIAAAVGAPIAYADGDIRMTASIGLVSFGADQGDAEDMMRSANLALMQAKRVGGDRVEPFRPAFRTVGAHSEPIEADLEKALERGEIEMHYQPIVRLETRRVAGFEALMRWRHPLRGLMTAGSFVPIAERTEVIDKLGRFAMHTAARDLHFWHRETGDENVFVSVNLSSRELMRTGLENDVRAVFAESPLPPGMLKLELTESLIMENPDQSVRVLAAVRELGAGLALDDFGTGYSSLSQLMRFPFDTIKIDRSFVANQGGHGRPVILRSIVSMAHDLGMEVVAEGAEDTADADELRVLGCEYAQGFLFGEAISAQLVLQVLKANSRKAA
ncbi:EAL domain-containing protein [Rhizobiaceae bacterium]|nr:EAL domain-containing protein [Rhizobiaceae bacterium]